MSLFILTQSRKGAKRKVDALSFPNFFLVPKLHLGTHLSAQLHCAHPSAITL